MAAAAVANEAAAAPTAMGQTRVDQAQKMASVQVGKFDQINFLKVPRFHKDDLHLFHKGRPCRTSIEVGQITVGGRAGRRNG